MADEETTDNTEETPVTPETEAAPEAPAAEAAPEAPETEAAPVAAEAEAAPAAPAAERVPAPAAERAEVVAPKERRRRARAAKAAKVGARPARSPEERHQDRVAQRTKKAEVRRGGRGRARAKASHEGAATTAPREHISGVQKTRQGVVVSDKADKTITVRIDTARRHRRYSKIVRTSRTLHAHDESNDAHIGDTVIVREARPLSRTKRWRLIQVIERAK